MGGHRGPGPGNWFEASVLSNVNHTMELMLEERTTTKQRKT